jgi:hypothetical protein
MNRRSRAAIVLFLVGLLVLGIFFVLPRPAAERRAVEAYKRTLIFQGEKLSVSDLAPTSARDTNRAQQFLNVMAGLRVPVNLPFETNSIRRGVSLVGYSNVTADQMVGYEQNIATVARIRDAVGDGQFEFQFNIAQVEQFSGVAQQHLALLKVAADLAAGTTTQALAVDDFPDARAEVLLAVNLVDLSHSEPFIVSQLVRAADARLATGATWEFLQSTNWNDTQLAELQSAWQNTDLFSNAGSPLRMERALQIQILVRSRQSHDDFAMAQLGTARSPAGSAAPRNPLATAAHYWLERFPHYWKWRSSTSFAEELYLLQCYAAALRCVEQTSSTGAFVPAMREMDQQLAALDRQFPARSNDFRIYASQDTTMMSYLRRLATAEASRRVTITAIALKRYQLAHDSYPDKLEALVPNFLPTVPLDFMDGQPLRYTLDPDGSFLLYSIGLATHDDGGTGPSDLLWPRAATGSEAADYLNKSGKAH